MSQDMTQNVMNTAVDTATQLSMKIIEFLDHLANNTKTHNLSMKDKNVVQVFKDYVKKGGQLKADVISLEESKVFEQLLRNKGIPFVAASTIDPDTKEQKVIYSTRANDKIAMEQVRKQFAYALGNSLNEISSKEFLENNIGQETHIIQDLSDIEVEVLKHNLINKDIPYALDRDTKTGKTNFIYSYRDEKEIEKILTLTAYDLSGNRGKLIEDKIKQNLDNKKTFKLNITPSKNETLYVVDIENPGNFIAVNKDFYSIHTLRNIQERGEDGKKHNVIRNVAKGKAVAYDKDAILKQTAYYIQKPVILTQDEMDLVKKVDENGRLTLSEPGQFMTTYQNMLQTLSLRNDYYKFNQTNEALNTDEKLYSITNLTKDELNLITDKMKDQGISHFVSDETSHGYCLVYTSEDKTVIDNILNKTIYQDLTDEKLFTAKINYEGRGHIDFKSNEPVLIKNMDSPNFEFKLTQNEFIIYNLRTDDNNLQKDPIHIDRNSAQFNQSVVPMLLAMENPVVLSGQELKLSNIERNEIYQERLNNPELEDVKSLLFNNLSIERENMISPEFREKEATLKQQKALGYKITWPKQIYVVDRNLIEKIAEHTFEQKKVNERGRQDITVDMDR